MGSSGEVLTSAQISDFNAAVLGLLDAKQEVQYATSAALPTNVYANGSSGVGATLIGTAFGALTVDGQTVTAGQRILVKDEVATANNGIYTVTTVGAIAAYYVLTRATDYDQAAEISTGDTIPVRATGTGGTANDGQVFLSSAPSPVVVGTSSLTFAAVGGGIYQPLSAVLTTYAAGGAGATAQLAALLNGTYALIDNLPWTISINPYPTAVTQTNWNTNASDAFGTSKNSSGAQNAQIGWDIVMAAGTWDIELMIQTASDQGIYTVALDGVSVGTIDAYAAGTTRGVRSSVTGIVVASTGKKRLTLTQATKNASSSAYYGVLYVGGVRLQRTA